MRSTCGKSINILLTDLSRSVWENLDLGPVYRPNCDRSVLTTSIKIFPYRHPARLIRAKYQCNVFIPEFLKTGLAKIRAHSTTWQLKAIKSVQRPIKKPISDAKQ